MDAYLDESTDGKQNQIFAIGGFIAFEDAWQQFNLVWRSRTTGLPLFHMTECETNSNTFSPENGWSKAACIALITDLVTALLSAPIFGYGCAISIEDFKALFPSESVESMYLLCFRHCVYELVKMSPERVGFAFHDHKDFAPIARKLYARLKEIAGPTWKHKLGAIAFDDPQSMTPLQSADFFAYETFKAFRNRRYHPTVPERRSIGRIASKSRMVLYNFDALKVIADQMTKNGYTSLWEYLAVTDANATTTA